MVSKSQKLNLLFICGSLEPGKDGVGDYSRRLACELIRQGHQASIVALNDKYINGIKPINEIQYDSETPINIIRLSSLMRWSEKHAYIKPYIEQFNPDWLSLQYVPFSFQKKGLPFFLPSFLIKLSEKRKWHIMFHELWVGMDVQSSYKYRVWGTLQRNIIKSIVRLLKPAVVHTQTKLYLQLLNELGCQTIYLPLFGNICLKHDRIANEKEINSKAISLVLFGSIHHGAPIKQFSEEATAFSLQTGCPVSITCIGRCGSEIENWIKEWKGECLSIKILGEQSPKVISRTLFNSDFGIATTPPGLIEKSGSVAAMQEHGLSIICVSRTWEPRYNVALNLPENVFQYSEGNLNAIFEREKKVVSVPITLSSVAEQFINNLNLWQA